MARRLDAAHHAGLIHGALHPSKVFVTDDATEIIAGSGAHAPYAAPEVIAGHGATAISDQFSLAAVAYEWLFGRPVAQAGDRPIEVRSMPAVDRPALSSAFTRALAPKPEDRFASCGAFCDALAGAVVPELPLAGVEDFEAEDTGAAPFDSERDDAFLDQGEPITASELAPIVAAPSVDDIRIAAEESNMTAAQPDVDVMTFPSAQPPPAAVPSWNPSATATPPRVMESPRFGPVALFLAVIVGAVFGFAAGYMARPRALQTQAPAEMAAAGTQGASGASSASGGAPKGAEAPAPKAPKAPKAIEAPKAAETPEKVGRLLVRSSPSGASVSVDGVARGETPIALRDLDFGTRSVTIARRGYVVETRRVSITKARPARTLDVRLAAASEPVAPKPAGGGGPTPREAVAPKPSTPATLGKPAVATGMLAIESRPTGAAVTVNGKPSGTTPLTINDLPPGEYRILMTMPGYRNFSTTVQVVAGERVRAAASLTALEQ